MKVSYQPLFNTLISKKILPKQLIEDGIISEAAMLDILKGECLAPEVLEGICGYLNCTLDEIAAKK
jgi:DNA-binding Xre family transcriptional regulator